MSKSKNSQINFPVKKFATEVLSVQQNYSATKWTDNVTKYVAGNHRSGHNATYQSGSDRISPNAYTMYASKADYGYYDFVVPGGGEYRYYGQTDSHVGQGPTDYSKWGLLPAGSFWLPDVPNSIVNQVIDEAKLKLSSSDINLATSLAEAKEAVETIARLLVNLAKLTAKFAKTYGKYTKVPKTYVFVAPPRKKTAVFKNRTYSGRNVVRYNQIKVVKYTPYAVGRKASKKSVHIDQALNNAEQAWLGAMYAFLPLWLDFKGLADTASRALQKNGAHLLVQRHLMLNGALPWVPVSRYSYPGGFSATGKYRYGAECKLNYRIDDTYQHFLASLGLLDPFAVWWELTPYSFVIDWLLPISTMLQATFSAEVGLTYLDGYTNKKSFCDFTIECCWYAKPKGKLPTVNFKNVAQVRAPLYSTFTGLYIKSPFSVYHSVSAIALIAQSLR